MTPWPASPAEWEALVTGLVPVVFLAACWLRDRRRPRPESLEEHDERARAIVAEPPLTVPDILVPRPRVRVIWHFHPCGCICDSTGRGIVCAADRLASVTNLSAWEKGRHQR